MGKLKILLPTTGLDIGGAETHVVGLAKQLKKMDYYPVVVSSGGVYVEELERNNIVHYHAPLNNRDFFALFKSLKIFSKIIKIEKIDIIHTHGRIASLVSKIISMRYNIPFMTTAHALFNHGGGLKYLTFWGEEIISISEDVKQHLIDKFGIKEDKITIIENGIDTDTFSTESKDLNIFKELKLKDDTIKILCVSRLSGTLANLVIEIIKSFPKLSEELGKIELIIVGDGDDYQEVENISKEIDFTGKSIKFLGKRTDIAEIMNIADLIIAVGRTALEAMAVEKPVILAGGEGYMGLLTPNNYDLAKSTNFTGRGIDDLKTENKLVNEIIDLFNTRSKDDIEALGKFGRKKIEEEFSIKEMTKETIQIYEKLLKDRGRFS